MNLYFLCFADSSNYGTALRRCEYQARHFQDREGNAVFREVLCLDESDLMNECPAFWQAHSGFVLQNSRGYGYWIWKPYLLGKLLVSMERDAVVFYMDSGCQLNYSAIDRFRFYYDECLNREGVCFRLTHAELKYTKMDTYVRVTGKQGDNLDELQILAGAMFLRNTNFNRNFVNEWYSICTESNYRYVDDSKSALENHVSFIDHRHDQSIFSLLVKKYTDFGVLDDETYWDDHERQEKSKNYPVWATRNRSDARIWVA